MYVVQCIDSSANVVWSGYMPNLPPIGAKFIFHGKQSALLAKQGVPMDLTETYYVNDIQFNIMNGSTSIMRALILLARIDGETEDLPEQGEDKLPEMEAGGEHPVQQVDSQP